jgi:hypothetical protein
MLHGHASNAENQAASTGSQLSSRACLLATIAAVIIGSIYFAVSLSVPIIHDAHGYYRIARQISTEGVFSKFELSEMRTYGYPAVLASLLTVADVTGANERALVFAIQLLAHIASAFLLRYALLVAAIRHWAASAAFYAVLLHPFALIYPAYMLTESLSLSLGTCVLACAISLFGIAPHRFWLGAAGGLLCGMMIAIRPANVYILPAWFLALLVPIALNRYTVRRSLEILLVGAAAMFIPLVPQLRNNLVYYDKLTPLVAARFAHGQQYIGILWIKYATSVIPGENPQILYLNPFATDRALAAAAPVKWYAQYPFRGAATLVLHAFNLLDQDMPLPYNVTLTPRYYPLVSVINLAVVAFAVCAAAFLFRIRGRLNGAERWACAVALVVVLSHLGLHSLFSVEARYGVAALVPIYGCAAVFAVAIKHLLPSVRLMVAGAVIAATAAGGALSVWVRSQSPAIRAAQALPSGREQTSTEPKQGEQQSREHSVALSFSPVDQWSLDHSERGPEESALLRSNGIQVSLIQHAITLETSTYYMVEFEVRAREGQAGELSVDFYAGPEYDHADQNLIVKEYRNSFTPVSFTCNSGADAPSAAFLRFATLSRDPIEIRNVRLSKLQSGAKGDP